MSYSGSCLNNYIKQQNIHKKWAKTAVIETSTNMGVRVVFVNVLVSNVDKSIINKQFRVILLLRPLRQLPAIHYINKLLLESPKSEGTLHRYYNSFAKDLKSIEPCSYKS